MKLIQREKYGGYRLFGAHWSAAQLCLLGLLLWLVVIQAWMLGMAVDQWRPIPKAKNTEVSSGATTP